AQPLAVEEVRPREIGTRAGAAEMLDRLRVEQLRGCGVAIYEGSATCLQAERPVSAAVARPHDEELEGGARLLTLVAARRRLDELHIGPPVDLQRAEVK